MMVWLERFADHLGLPPSQLAEVALSDLASDRGFEPPPKAIIRPAGIRPVDTISNCLINLIISCNYSLYFLSTEAGIPQSSMNRFIRGEGGINLGAADKIADFLGVTLVPAPHGGGKAAAISTKLRIKIKSSNESYAQLAIRCGFDPKTIYRFMDGHDIRLSTAGKLAEAKGMTLVPKGKRGVSVSPPNLSRPPDRRKAVCCVQLAEATPDNPTPWKTPPRVLHLIKARLTEKQYTVVHSLVKAGPDGLSGAALQVASGVTGCLRILKMLKASDPGWDFAICFPKKGNTGYRIN